jgi:pimeloyl-ACP methyl ester carboxylesterase
MSSDERNKPMSSVQTHPTKADTLKVPGATIYHEVRGSGPVLLMIPGGPADAGVFAGLMECVADRYMAVAYDPRGNSRSTFDGAPEEQQLDVHGDDAARLIEALGDEPAYVLGSSGGAQIALNLAARHPQRVRALVAHEPPCLLLLPDPAEGLKLTQAVYDTYRREGVGPAMQQFMMLGGMAGRPAGQTAPAPPNVEAAATLKRIDGNLDYFLAHGLKPIGRYVPDVETLRAGPVKVVVGVGKDSEGQVAHRAAVALAGALGMDPVTFPGDHNGYGAYPDTFGEVLHRVLRAASLA